MSEDKEEGGGSLNRNPDVLSCLANLSNDEVFTPPEVANAMLDLLPKELFENPETTFLDPASKSGVFLREIAKRLIEGLKGVIPDLEARVDHICKKQIFALSPTMLTALASRRTLYCSVHPAGKYSVAHFDNDEGNIRYFDGGHTFQNGRCSYCGASEAAWGEEARKGKESHAYEFIHGWQAQTLGQGGKMHFDVIVGNPPYQLSTGGGQAESGAAPIYQYFVENAKMLNPNFITMIMPSRWYTGGTGLGEFRKTMLNDKHIRELHDFIDANNCFPNVEIKGGVCYFLWDSNYSGDCKICSHDTNGVVSETIRPLLENGLEIFVRNNQAVPILHKVKNMNEKSFSEIISANDPFGFDVRVENSYKRVKPIYELKPFDDSVVFYYNGWRQKGLGYIGRTSITKGNDLVDKCKVLIPKAWGVGNLKTDCISPFIAECPSVCTETYLVVGPFENTDIANNAISYMKTKFFHLMVSLIKISQNTMQKAYSLVPLQNFTNKSDIDWTASIAELDEQLYKKYSLTSEEVAFIEKMVRPMD